VITQLHYFTSNVVDKQLLRSTTFAGVFACCLFVYFKHTVSHSFASGLLCIEHFSHGRHFKSICSPPLWPRTRRRYAKIDVLLMFLYPLQL